MGKEIVYCAACGKRLREEDFERGLAHSADHQAWCAACRPLPARPEAPSGSTRKVPHVSPPRTARRQAQAPRSRAAVAGVAVGAVLLLAVVAAVLSSPARRPEEPVARIVPEAPAPAPVPPPRPAPPPPKPAPAARPPEAVLRDLEALAAGGGDPTAVLFACEEARPLLRGTPHEAALRRIEEAARERAERGRDAARLDAFLAQIRSIAEGDAAGERRKEIRDMYETALGMAGPRRDEVATLKERWEESVKAAALPKSVYRQDFSSGAGGFSGQVVPEGVEGTPALRFGPAGTNAWGKFRTPVRESTRLRLKFKPTDGVGRVQVMVWSEARKDNGRYFIDRLRPGEWTAVEFRALDLLMTATRQGPPMELGEPFNNLKIMFEGHADARLLLDDVEVLE